MTTAYLRVKRNNNYENIVVEDLTETERISIFTKKTKEELVNWINFLCLEIKKNEKILEDLVEQGILEHHELGED